MTLEELGATINDYTGELLADEEYDPPPSSATLKKIRFLHLFSGPRRWGDLKYYLK